MMEWWSPLSSSLFLRDVNLCLITNERSVSKSRDHTQAIRGLSVRLMVTDSHQLSLSQMNILFRVGNHIKFSRQDLFCVLILFWFPNRSLTCPATTIRIILWQKAKTSWILNKCIIFKTMLTKNFHSMNFHDIWIGILPPRWLDLKMFFMTRK